MFVMTLLNFSTMPDRPMAKQLRKRYDEGRGAILDTAVLFRILSNCEGCLEGRKIIHPLLSSSGCYSWGNAPERSGPIAPQNTVRILLPTLTDVIVLFRFDTRRQKIHRHLCYLTLSTFPQSCLSRLFSLTSKMKWPGVGYLRRRTVSNRRRSSIEIRVTCVPQKTGCPSSRTVAERYFCPSIERRSKRLNEERFTE